MSATPLLSQLPSYEETQTLATRLKEASVSEMLAADPERAARFTRSAAGLQLDFSKQLPSPSLPRAATGRPQRRRAVNAAPHVPTVCFAKQVSREAKLREPTQTNLSYEPRFELCQKDLGRVPAFDQYSPRKTAVKSSPERVLHVSYSQVQRHTAVVDFKRFRERPESPFPQLLN